MVNWYLSDHVRFEIAYGYGVLNRFNVGAPRTSFRAVFRYSYDDSYCLLPGCVTMLEQLFLALCLMAVCVVIHATGVATALRWLPRQQAAALGLWDLCWLFIRLAGWMILLHLGEIGVWAVIYLWRGAIGDIASALYFSAVTYTTTGYGDLVLPADWRLVGAIEALTGILMCGLSSGFFFAVVSRAFDAKPRPAAPMS